MKHLCITLLPIHCAPTPARKAKHEGLLLLPRKNVLEIFEPECEGLLSTSPQVAVNLSPAKFRRALPREVQKVRRNIVKHNESEIFSRPVRKKRTLECASNLYEKAPLAPTLQCCD